MKIPQASTPTRIAVIAADGRTGQQVVAQLLDNGFTVVAGVYNQSSTLEPSKHLSVKQCDARDSEDVEQLLVDCDAVVSLIGHGTNSPARLQTEAMKQIVHAMEVHGVTRLISLTGTGVRRYGDTPSLIDQLLNAIIARVDPDRVKDGIAHAEFLATTQLDWTIIRVLKLTNQTYSGERVNWSLHGPAELFTSRQKVATSVVQLLQDNSYIRQLPIITKRGN